MEPSGSLSDSIKFIDDIFLVVAGFMFVAIHIWLIVRASMTSKRRKKRPHRVLQKVANRRGFAIRER